MLFGSVTTTIFSAVHAILIRPLPYPNADELVTVYAQTSYGELKLGVVGPFDTATLRIPDGVVDESSHIDFFIEPKRGAEQESGYLELERGEHIGLVVPER